MKIQKVTLDNFMLFDHIDTTFSPNINIIFGENSTGKTALIKLLYSCVNSCATVQNARVESTKGDLESTLVSKFQGVFRPDKYSIGRLVKRRPGQNRTDITIHFDSSGPMTIGFSRLKDKHIDLDFDLSKFDKATNAVYIPPKEIISAMENFVPLYDQYHIAIEETYYDLARLLERPLKKGKNTTEQNTVLKKFGKIVDGSVTQKDRVFYLKATGIGEIEMGLVSEGYRKLSTIMYLILSGSLTKDSVLFWDEPETNMNPKMIRPMVDALVELAKLGVQVFVTTHDYFVQQCFNMAQKYQQDPKNPLNYQYISLNRVGHNVELESTDTLQALSHNAVMEEFDALYDREQEFLYGN